jgi:hypothetical protein
MPNLSEQEMDLVDRAASAEGVEHQRLRAVTRLLLLANARIDALEAQFADLKAQLGGDDAKPEPKKARGKATGADAGAV